MTELLVLYTSGRHLTAAWTFKPGNQTEEKKLCSGCDWSHASTTAYENPLVELAPHPPPTLVGGTIRHQSSQASNKTCGYIYRSTVSVLAKLCLKFSTLECMRLVPLKCEWFGVLSFPAPPPPPPPLHFHTVHLTRLIEMMVKIPSYNNPHGRL